MENKHIDDRDVISPILAARECEGWLAIAQKHAIFRVGVTAATKESASERFGSAYSRWVEIQTLYVPK